MGVPGASELRKKLLRAESGSELDEVIKEVATANRHSPLLGKQCSDPPDKDTGQSRHAEPGYWENFLVVMNNAPGQTNDSPEGFGSIPVEANNPETDRSYEEKCDIQAGSFSKQNVKGRATTGAGEDA